MTALNRNKLLLSLTLVWFASGCVTSSLSEVMIETPIKPKLDVSSFERVLVAGFVAGGSQELNANLETVRLLRSQLRIQDSMQVVDANTLLLNELVEQQIATTRRTLGESIPLLPPDEITEEQDFTAYERVFTDADFWQRLGKEHRNPLIITGTVLFRPQARTGFVTREQETYDAFGRRQVQPTRTYSERQGFVLSPKFIFIDGQTGTVIYTESHREEILYDSQQNTPPLSGFFELMDRIIPTFLSSMSTQTIRGSRTLLR